jgi:excisionase family DNA binding protein
MAVRRTRQNFDADFATVPEVAAILGVSPSTIWRWIASGELPAYRVGLRFVRVRRSELSAVIRPLVLRKLRLRRTSQAQLNAHSWNRTAYGPVTILRPFGRRYVSSPARLQKRRVKHASRRFMRHAIQSVGAGHLRLRVKHASRRSMKHARPALGQRPDRNGVPP